MKCNSLCSTPTPTSWLIRDDASSLPHVACVFVRLSGYVVGIHQIFPPPPRYAAAAPATQAH